MVEVTGHVADLFVFLLAHVSHAPPSVLIPSQVLRSWFVEKPFCSMQGNGGQLLVQLCLRGWLLQKHMRLLFQSTCANGVAPV